MTNAAAGANCCEVGITATLALAAFLHHEAQQQCLHTDCTGRLMPMTLRDQINSMCQICIARVVRSVNSSSCGHLLPAITSDLLTDMQQFSGLPAPVSVCPKLFSALFDESACLLCRISSFRLANIRLGI